MPAHERSHFERVLSDLARTRVLPARMHPSDPRTYHGALVGEPFVSPASRFRRIGEDAEADLRLIDPFGAVAARVLAADRTRMRSLAYMRDVEAGEVTDASARVIENRCLIAWVRSELRERTVSYRYALEHAFLAMPQEEALEAERAVRALDRYRGVLDELPAPSWRQGMCIETAAPAVARAVRASPPAVVKD
jgi:hypothetical protein